MNKYCAFDLCNREVLDKMRMHGMDYFKIVKPVGARSDCHALNV
jgi:hypothetical protein